MRKIKLPLSKRQGKKAKRGSEPDIPPTCSAADPAEGSWHIVKRVTCDYSEKKAILLAQCGFNRGSKPHWPPTRQTSDGLESLRLDEAA